MNKIYLGLAIFLILSMSVLSISAEKTIPDVKQGDCANLYQSCDNCSFVNITRITVQGITKVYGPFLMDKYGTDYNYTFCTNTELGTHTYYTCGDLNGGLICEPVSYDVTPSGITQNSILNNPILLILLGISLLFLILALYTRNYPMGFLSGIMFLISGIYTMIYGFNNYTDDYSRTVGMVLIGLGFIFMFASGYEWISDVRDEGIIAGSEDEEE